MFNSVALKLVLFKTYKLDFTIKVIKFPKTLKIAEKADILNVSKQNGFGIKNEHRPLDLEEKAIVSLIYKFLKAKNMDVVLSILLPAVGMHSHNDVLSDEDISSFLNLSPSENTQPGKVFLLENRSGLT